MCCIYIYVYTYIHIYIHASVCVHVYAKRTSILHTHTSQTSSILSSSSTQPQETATISSMQHIDKIAHELRSITVTSPSPPSLQSPLLSSSVGSIDGVGAVGEGGGLYGVTAKVVSDISVRGGGNISKVFRNHRSFMC